jgi:hypothetical protein
VRVALAPDYCSDEIPRRVTAQNAVAKLLATRQSDAEYMRQHPPPPEG